MPKASIVSKQSVCDVEPTPTFSDYTRAAADSIRRHRKRGLLVLITNCRDEDATELSVALGLLRSRHLVVLANLREKIVGEIANQRDLNTQRYAASLLCVREASSTEYRSSAFCQLHTSSANSTAGSGGLK